MDEPRPRVVIASGPSLTDEDVAHVYRSRHRVETIVINDNYRKAPWADVLYACDLEWWDIYIDDVRAKFSGELWTINPKAAQRHRLNHIKGVNKPGLGREFLHTGGNSGYQGINLAYLRSRRNRELFFLGFDMRGGHWFGDHPKGLRNQNMETHAPNFPRIAKDLREEGFDAVNCSRDTILECFRRSTIQEVLK